MALRCIRPDRSFYDVDMVGEDKYVCRSGDDHLAREAWLNKVFELNKTRVEVAPR